MSCILDCFSKCVLLSKQKEDEVTWSKIDTTFIKLKDKLSYKEDCSKFMEQFSDLLLRSILSERSKLSGSSILLLKKLCNILQNEIKNVNSIISALLKLSGRSNKIVYTRAHDALEHLSQFIDVSQYYKFLLESFESTNKNVRLGVIKFIKNNKTDNLKIQKLIEKGKTDTFIEIRNICKDYKKEVSISKIPILRLKISLESPVVQHSPFKKILKIEENEDVKNLNKILELEKQVNKITNYKKIEKKTKPILFKPQIVKKEIQDDLTPKKLDKYLSKYRNIYGNILKDKGNDLIEINNEENDLIEINNEENDLIEINNEENDLIEINNEENPNICDLSKDIENISLVEESNIEALTYEYTIMNSDKIGNDYKDNDEDNEIGNDYKENNIEDNEIGNDYKENNIEDNEIGNDCKELKNEDNENENDYKDEVSKNEDNENEVLFLCTKNNQNRFSPLLFADKEECVIYDINAESPLFKKTNTENTNNCSSSISKSVINTAVSSSFLYSNDDNSIDYTKIDSVIFVDKNLFKSNKK